MNFYDKEDIKQAISCKEMAVKLGATINDKGTHCNAVWRGGDNPTAVSFDKNDKTRAYDHVKQNPIDVIDMFAQSRNLTFALASTMLGNELNLTPSSEQPTIKRSKVISEHIYTDEIGKPVHKVVRYEPKSFKQFEYIGDDWKAGTENVKEFYPLYVQDIMTADIILINEGEKACDACKSLGYKSTTFAMGAGKWNDSYKKWFNKKHVVIISDNDDAGNKHARILCWNLKDTAETIKIVKISDKVKGDFADFVEDGGTKKQADAIIKKADYINLRTLNAPEDIVFQSKRDIARMANKTPFRNYIIDYEDVIKTDKKTGAKTIVQKPLFEAVFQDTLIDDLHSRMIDFPRVIGSGLFDFNFDTKEVVLIDKEPDLLSRITTVTKHNVEFKRPSDIPGAISTGMLFSALINQSKYKYNMISKIPFYPEREDVFCINHELPEPTNGEIYFDKFIDFFNPATHNDRILLKAAVATVFWYRRQIKRPAFIIGTEKGGGQGIGKTTFVEKIGLLCDEEPFRITQDTIKNESGVTEFQKDIASSKGRGRRLVLLDNVTGFFRNQTFADFLTRSSYSVMPKYAHHSEVRDNDITYFITANSASFDRDIIHRSFIIELKPPKENNKDWDSEINKFINAHRFQIISDIIQTLKNGGNTEYTPKTRNKPWEKDVLQPMVKSKEEYDFLIQNSVDKAQKADGESETSREILNFFYDKINKLDKGTDEYSGKFDAEEDVIWITNGVIKQWCSQAMPGFGGRSGGAAVHILKTLIATHAHGNIAEITEDKDKWLIGDWISNDIFNRSIYPPRSKKCKSTGKIIKPKTGLLWNPVKYSKNPSKYNTGLLPIITEDMIYKQSSQVGYNR